MRRFDLETSFIRHVVHPVWARRDHPAFARYLRQFQETQYLSKIALAELQRGQVRNLLHHAFDHCAFYRQRIEEAKLRPADFEDVGCLTALPPLTKTDIQQNMQTMMADNVPESERVPNQTGGSTGAPLQFYVDKERLDSRMASTARHDSWAGFHSGDWVAYLWGARLDMITTPSTWDFLRNRLLYRRIELNTSSISEKDWVKFISEVRRIKPRVMLAYAQSAVLFANYVKDHGISDITFDSIITTSEILFPEQRTLLEEVFAAKVFNRYGSREVSVIASECDEHSGMHVNADALFLELHPDANVQHPSGKILITDMLNRSMPLIRYEIGDIARWADDDECACGRRLPRLQELQGRLTDFLVMPDGSYVSGVALLTWVFADVKELQHVQIVQDAYDRITLRIVPKPSWDASVEKMLRERFARYLHPDVKIVIEQCANVEMAVSGKRRFVINQIPAGASIPVKSRS